MSNTKEISIRLNEITNLSAELFKGKVSIEINSDITDMYESASFAELDIDQLIRFRDYLSEMISIILKEQG